MLENEIRNNREAILSAAHNLARKRERYVIYR